MLNKKLSDIVEIITGYSFRTAIENSKNGKYRVIQAKDISDGLEIDDSNLMKVNLEKFNTNALTKKNDILLTSRGRYQSAIFTSSNSVIASSSVFIIRVINQNVDPHYLSIFLNSRHGQIQLEKLTSGNYIKSIPKANLGNLIIQVPTLSLQTKIVSLSKNIINQQKLLKRKIDLISNISENSLIKILN
jgi:restriction endonuclease S subunit